MLRLIFVLGIAGVGLWYALKSPFYALLFYVWNAYFRPEAWVWSETFVLSLNISLVAALIVVGGAAFSSRHWPFNGHLALVMAFGGHCVLSTSLSDYAQWPSLVEFLKVLLMTYMIVVLVHDLARLRTLLVVLALSLGFEAVKQGWFEVFLHPGARNDNTLPFLGDNNGVAVGLWMLVPVLGALSQTTDRRWLRRLSQVAWIGTAYRALTTYSRGGLLAGIAVAAVYLLRSHKKLIVLVSVLLVIALVVSVMPDEFWERMGTISEGETTEDRSAQGRLHFWNVALAMANAHPIFGVGLRAYEAAYDDFDSSNGWFGSGRAVHSIWFGVLGELGYIGFGLYGLIFFQAIRNCRRVQRLPDTGRDVRELKAYAIAIEGGLVAFVVGGTFLSNQYFEMPWHWVGLTIVLAGLSEKLSRGGAPLASTPIQAPRSGP
jgi:probable O-glycosylation ligase (exosortase A-associated)